VGVKIVRAKIVGAKFVVAKIVGAKIIRTKIVGLKITRLEFVGILNFQDRMNSDDLTLCKDGNKMEEEIINCNWSCYLLKSENSTCTYVGSTNNLKRRIRQHNGEIKGGAKYTSKNRPWSIILFIQGFKTKNHCLSFEWHWKYQSRKQKGNPIQKRNLALQILLNQNKNYDLNVFEQ
jgi:predicted GIY-YIG superfamily endonuclease